jgi:putative ABC transport system permease protein
LPLRPTDPDDFAINQQDQIVSMIQRVMAQLARRAFHPDCRSSLEVSASDIMFVSVAERTREIGIRKPSAQNGGLFCGFLIEAATICLIGGAVGLESHGQ